MFHSILLLLQQATPDLPSVGTLLMYGGALLTSYGLSKAKTLDTSVTNSPWFRKVQPVITLGGAFLAPYLASKLGVSIDPSSWGQAPLATVITVAGAEVLSIIKRSVK